MNSLKQHYVMMIYNKLLSVVPITTHIKLKNVHKRINKTIIINKIKTLNNYYYKLFKKKPRIAVLGVNPHNSEFRKNSEEQRIIIPTIIKLKKLDIKVSGPYSADTVFVEKKRNNFDVIIGMYHDQVLTPFKTLFEFDAINITLGLDYIRLSPDHGTAVDIIKKNKANTTSLMNSIKFIEKL
jgi:4-hydroxy-L-threonine phosphate dehydrogenase PdxA